MSMAMAGMLEFVHLRDDRRMHDRSIRHRRPFWYAWCLALLATHGGVHALGFGQASHQVVLGQALDFTAEVRIEPEEVAEADCLRAEVSFGEVRLGGSQVRTQWDSAKDAVGSPSRRIVRVSTQSPVSEPIVTVDITVGCKTRLSRQFVVFADPPAVQSSPQAAAAPAVTRPSTGPATAAPPAAAAPSSVGRMSAQSSAAADARPQGRRSRDRADARGASRSRSAPAVTAPAPRSAARSAPARGAAVEQPRLRLDPIDAELFSTPKLQLSTVLGQADAVRDEDRQAAAALWRALSTTPEQAAQEAQRLRQLEQSLEALRQESAATRQALEGLQASLRQAQAERYANPLVYALLVLCVALAAGMVWMARRRSPAPGAWWRPSALGSLQADPGGGASVGAALGEPSSRATAAVGEAPPGATPSQAITSPPLVVAEPSGPASPQAVVREPAAAAVATAPVPPSVHGDADPGKVAVEELIDLEQQAEFFIVLGQDESAIELLRGHLREHRDPSPMPYMKLLEIYKRRGERQAYDEVREEFNRRFNAYAPAWEEGLGAGRSLEEYPTVIDRLQALWETPVRAIEVLQASLLRGDAGSKGFDLPAYRELLMLYGIARERVQLESTGELVDVLLPLDEPQEPYGSRLEPSANGHTGGRSPAQAAQEAAVDLHLDLAEAAAPASADRGQETDAPADSRLIEFEPIDVPAPDPEDRGRSG